MSKQFTDTTKDEQKTLPQTPAPPRVSPPPPRPKGVNRVMIATVILVFAIIVGGGALVLALVAQRPPTPVKPTPVPTTIPVTPTTGSDLTPTPVPGVIFGPQALPAPLNDPAYWEKIVGTQSGVNKVESVSGANMMGTPTLQALITVRANSPAATLDVYVYNNISSAKPVQIFKLQGLLKGDAKISGYNTVMTAEVDKNSALNASKPLSLMTRDLFREFKWSDEQGTLVQTAFPGIFPDLTRYQAEADQALVNKGQDTWKNDPAQVAKAMAAKFLSWQRPLVATLLSGGGPQDVYASVLVKETPISGTGFSPTIDVTLSRLEGNTHNMWVVIGVEGNKNFTLTNIAPHSLIASPATLEGKGAAFEAVIGKAVIFDHAYADIGHAQITGTTSGMGISDYSTRVVYTSTYRQGVQEGIVAVFQDNGGMSSDIANAVMIKVLLDPEPGVALGPLPGPDKLKNPAYWTPFVSTPTMGGVAQQVFFGNLLGKPSLQAVVVAQQVIGGGPAFRSVFVFDDIMAATPKLLFKVEHLLHGDARISGYSSIMTAEVDLNSVINKGKLDTQVTVDLFREFEWTAGKGTFVQVAFPGMYPDLTRYQAEQDQVMVSHGQNTWKNDPVQVAKAMAAKFLSWQRPLVATLLSGGGPQDVYANVLVKETPLSGPGFIPTANVTLSRLEGNTHNMWVVIGVEGDQNFTLTNIASRSLIASPVTLKGKGAAYEATIGKAVVYDHLYTDIGHAQIIGTTSGMGISDYSTGVVYTSTYRQGVQEGIVAVFQDNAGVNLDLTKAVMIKVLLKP
jgi:hypothetical protein